MTNPNAAPMTPEGQPRGDASGEAPSRTQGDALRRSTERIRELGVRAERIKLLAAYEIQQRRRTAWGRFISRFAP